MDATARKLCDIDSIDIPAEMLSVRVDEQAVEDDVARLGIRYAAESEEASVCPGDTVCCRADSESYPDGRTVLLYTAVALPGAESAAQAALGKGVGERFETTLADRSVALTVEKILRRTPAEVNDALIASLGLDGVSTVEQYRAYIRAKRLDDLRMERGKKITRYIVDRMHAESEFDYDESQMQKMIDEELALYAADCAEAGMDMSEQELREAIVNQTKQGWLAKAFCESRGLEIDRASAEQYADQMIEMMTLMGEEVPEREAMLDMALQNEYFRAFYEYIDQIIQTKMEG